MMLCCAALVVVAIMQCNAIAHHLSFRGKIRDVGPIMKFQQQQQQIDLDLLK
jgi:hypothetical protein